MKTSTAKLSKLVITDVPRLDPIHVYLEDLRPSAGSIIVRCFDRAWYAYWGAMGKEKDGSPTTVRQFLMWANSDYIATNLIRGTMASITNGECERRDMQYLTRIAEAIQHYLRDTQPRMTKAQLERSERLGHANALIKVISDHGRRFFWNDKDKRLARIEMDDRGRLWWIDDYKESRVCMEVICRYEHRWRGFSHGGTLKQLAQEMRNYIKTGETISVGYIASSYWGYVDEAAAACKAQAAALPIIH